MWAKEQGLSFEYNPYKNKKDEDSNFWEMGWIGVAKPIPEKRCKLIFN
jgi:hypothetical protein